MLGVEINWKLVIFCLVWYFSSVVSSSATKNILMDFKHPVSLTEIQFVMNAFFCFITVFLFHHLQLRNYNSVVVFPQGTFPVDLGKHSYEIKQFLNPNRLIFKTTVPMGMFQFMGQIASHNATSLIPVSLVHTIKALSPMTTVLIYKIIFNKAFSYKTYLTLIPLCLGVMLSCSKNTSKHTEDGLFHKGCIFAFVSMLIFVSQNIFAKRILTWDDKSKVDDIEELRANEFLKKFNWRITRTESAISTPILPISQPKYIPASAASSQITPQINGSSGNGRANFYLSGNNDSFSSFTSPLNSATSSRNPSHLDLSRMDNANDVGYINPERKLDKLTVLFYCSIVGFGLTFPIYFFAEFNHFKQFGTLTILKLSSTTIKWIYIYSVFHFIQSLVAFQILGMVSPINYSIANILKRIIIISFAIIIEGNHTKLSGKQWLGLFLTFGGLYAYDRWGTERNKGGGRR